LMVKHTFFYSVTKVKLILFEVSTYFFDREGTNLTQIQFQPKFKSKFSRLFPKRFQKVPKRFKSKQANKQNQFKISDEPKPNCNVVSLKRKNILYVLITKILFTF
jgi:hypothetical protein